MKSIKIKLKYSNSKKQEKLLEIFRLLDLVSKDYLTIRKSELDSKIFKPFKEHYAIFRALYPSLNSGVLQSHMRAIDSHIKAYVSWCKKKHKLVSFPETIRVSIPLRNDMFSFENSKNTKGFDSWFKFLRTYFPLSLCDYHKLALEDFESLSDSSVIKDQSGNLCLRLVFKTKDKTVETDKTLGIDIGIAKPIVFSDCKMIGSGRHIKHKKLEYGKKRAKNQKLKDQVTAKQSRWTNDLNHKLSREAVDYALSQGTNVLSLEKLEGTQLSNRRFRKYSWAFKDLLSKIAYKAQNAGLKVVHVDPRYTSQTCNSCGLKSKSNRKTQSRFHCCNCNLIANADVNAAKNIARLSTGNGLPMNPTIGKTQILETQPSLVVG